MDSLFFGNFRNIQNSWGFSAIINGLVDADTTYNIVYEAVVNNPAYVIFSDSSPEHKRSILSKMIKHYELKEDYEKCAELLRIKKSISNDNS